MDALVGLAALYLYPIQHCQKLENVLFVSWVVWFKKAATCVFCCSYAVTHLSRSTSPDFLKLSCHDISCRSGVAFFLLRSCWLHLEDLGLHVPLVRP